MFSSIDGVALLNDDGGVGVFFPNNSFVNDTTLTNTTRPPAGGNDHFGCYGAHVTWHNHRQQLRVCTSAQGFATRCVLCGSICIENDGVGLDPPLNGHANIHIFTGSSGYMNQELFCRISSGQSAFIGVFLKNGGGYMIWCVLYNTHIHSYVQCMGKIERYNV